MNPSTISSSETNPIERHPRKLRFVLTALTAFVLSVAIFYAEEDWRGKRAWENCKRELETKGAVLDWNKQIPPPVPDDQNFFKARKMTEWFVRDGQTFTNELTARLSNLKTDTAGTATNAITTEDDAREYLTWSDQFEPDFNLIREALKRPYARMDGNYAVPSEGPVPNFVAVRAVARTLAQRAHSCVLLNQPAQALRELTLMHDLCRVLEGAPTGKPMTLVAAMINVAVNGLYAGVVADGFQKHTWQEPQLITLQNQLAEMNPVPLVLEAFRMEQSAVNGYKPWLFMYNATNLWQKLKSNGFWLFEVAPRGWTYQNMAVTTELYQKLWTSVDAPDFTFSPRKIDAAVREVGDTLNSHSPYLLMGRAVIPNFGRAAHLAAYNQTMVNEAQIVCALERYHLAHGEYPQTLDALMPQFIEKIPHDLINGQPLHYRHTSGAKFLLYSVGWNETDDGGLPAENAFAEKGDWVWPGAR